MRFFRYFALSAFFALAGASSAWAYQFEMTTAYGGEQLAVGESLTVDVFFDTTPPDIGVTILSIGVIYDGQLSYNGPASEALPPQGPGASGAQPSYLLYSPAGPGMPPDPPATFLIPASLPLNYFLTFPGSSGIGGDQVNVFFIETGLNTATATGTGLYLASLVFDVIAEGDGTADIALEFTSSNVLQSSTIVIDPATIPLLGTPVVVSLPEPAVGGLALTGLVTLTGVYLMRRRRARR